MDRGLAKTRNAQGLSCGTELNATLYDAPCERNATQSDAGKQCGLIAAGSEPNLEERRTGPVLCALSTGVGEPNDVCLRGSSEGWRPLLCCHEGLVSSGN